MGMDTRKAFLGNQRIYTDPKNRCSIFIFIIKKIKRRMLFLPELGLMFYESTGRNSKQPKTWLPNLGIRHDQWIRKPNCQFTSALKEFCLKEKIEEEITLKRLGTDRTACISASLKSISISQEEVSFWQKEKGIKLEKFLRENHPQYFLSEELIKEIAQAIHTQHLVEIIGTKKINNCLEELGSIVPVHYFGRLPSDEENDFFNHNRNKEGLFTLRMILRNQTKPEPDTLYYLQKLTKQPNEFSYAVKHFLFENDIQLNQFKQIMKEKGNITQIELEQINLLNNLILPKKFAYYKNNYYYRQAFRKLRFHHYSIKFLKMMKLLNSLDCLLNSCSLLKRTYIRNVFYDLFARHLLSKDAVQLVKKLHQLQLLTDHKDLLLDANSFKLLIMLNKQNKICSEEIRKIREQSSTIFVEKEKKPLDHIFKNGIMAIGLQENSIFCKNNIGDALNNPQINTKPNILFCRKN